MSRINFLPPWVETNLQPAFYDLESGTCLQQTSRMYAKVNQLIRSVNDQNDTIAEYVEKFIELKDYVEEYFENLDVQEAIDNKIDEMANDGTLQVILNESIIPYINSEVETIKSDVNNLNEILSSTMDLSPRGAYSTTAALISANPSTGIYIITGNGHIYQWTHGGDTPTDLGAYQTAVNNFTTNILNAKDWIDVELGADGYSFVPDVEAKVISGAGAMTDSTTRLTTIERYRLADCDTINVYHGFQVSAGVWDKDGEWLGYYHAEGQTSPLWTSNILPISKIYDLYPTADSFKVMLRKSGDTTIDLTDRTNFQFIIEKYKNYVYYGKSLVSSKYVPNTWINGIFTAGGAYSSNSARMITDEFIDLRYFQLISSTNGVEFGIGVWDSNYTWLGYLKSVDGTTNTGPTYWTSLDITELDKTRKYKLYAKNTDGSDIDPTSAYIDITIDFNTPDALTPYITVEDSGVVIEDSSNSSNDIWTEYDARLAFGMDTTNAPVPVINKQQMINYGTLIMMKGGNGNDNKYNRWGKHVLEAYDRTNYNRITMLTDKHEEGGRKNAELYYYTGASHANSAYGNFKLGSDVLNHSFNFNRDEMIAMGVIDARSVMQLARINPSTDLITTYNTYAEADAAYEPDQVATSANNAKCCKYIQLKNAEDGAMWYDSVRHKVVVKVNGVWCDMQTTPVPEGTYNF